MTGFDIAVLLFVGFGAITGFMRGFVQEVISISAWIFAIFAIRLLHAPLTAILQPYVGYNSSTAVLAFVILMLFPYFTARMVAKWAGSKSRTSVLGPIDRVLGLGFGVMKGVIIVVLAFSILVLGYDTIWGAAGRPDWLKQSRSYPFVNASSEALVKLIAQRRQDALDAEAEAS